MRRTKESVVQTFAHTARFVVTLDTAIAERFLDWYSSTV